MATAEMTPEEKIGLIKSQLQEVLRPDIIEDVIVKQNRPLKIYWGMQCLWSWVWTECS